LGYRTDDLAPRRLDAPARCVRRDEAREGAVDAVADLRVEGGRGANVVGSCSAPASSPSSSSGRSTCSRCCTTRR
jgi:hypothetical protein